MKGIINAAALSAAVKTAQSVISSALKIEAYQHVRMTAKGGTLEIEATNFDQHMALNIPCGLSDGCAIVDPARLLMALAPIKGDVTISCAETHMSLSGKGSRSRLAILPADVWQGIEAPRAENSFDVRPESLLAAFNTVLPAVLNDPSCYYLCGCNLRWDGLDLIAEGTDRHVLLARQIVATKPKAWPDVSIIVPREFMIASAKLLSADSASLSVTESRVILTTPGGRLASKLIAATYPNTDRVWDKNAAPALRADRKSLLAIAKLAHLFSDANDVGERRLVIHDGEVITVGKNGETFRSAFEHEYIKAIDYSWQPRVLITALEALTSETVEFTDGALGTSIVVHGDGARTCVAMQMPAPAWWRREMAAQNAEAA
jgi:DNA polymerase III sliding clamp (beta) subunit (PCNA family)